MVMKIIATFGFVLPSIVYEFLAVILVWFAAKILPTWWLKLGAVVVTVLFILDLAQLLLGFRFPGLLGLL